MWNDLHLGGIFKWHHRKFTRMSESRKYVFFILLFQFFKTRIRSVPMISSAVAKIFWGLFINRLSGEVSFLLADKRNSILFNMYCFSFSWAERFILSKLSFSALPNVHANMCYLIQTDRAHLGAPIVFGQWNLRTSKNLKNCIYLGSWERRKHCTLRSTYWEQIL